MRATAAHTHEDAPEGGPFRDGLGERRLVVDPDTREVLEYLDLIPELGAQERAIRERVERLSNFRNVRFPRLHQVLSEKVGQATVVSVVAEHAPGQRLSELLAYVDRHPTLVFDVNAVLQVAREVLPAIAVLHDSRGVTHGALSLERLVLSPHGRVGIVDHALGAALTKLQFPRTRLWRDFRIAMPPSAGIPRFDTRADVAGVATALLALLIGRPLAGGEFAGALRSLLDSAVERLPNGTVRQLSTSLKAWFERALPIEHRKPYATALEAQLGLEDALKKESSYSPSPGALKSFLQRYDSGKPREDGTRGSRHAAPAHTGSHGTASGSTATAPAGPASRAVGRRRLTPEEESAEEIRAMEAELVRLAREEAASAAAPSPVSPAPDEVVPEVLAAPVEPEPVQLQVEPQVTIEPETLEVPATPTPEPPSIEAEIEAEIEAVAEVEIVSLGKELPQVDVAALAGDTLSVVVEDSAAVPPSDVVFVAAADTAVTPPAADEEEIQALEALLRQYDFAEEAPVAEVVTAEASEPGWMLTPPVDGPGVLDREVDEPPPHRDDRTLLLDFDAPPVPDYVVRLFNAGWVTAHLVAKPAPVARRELYRLQMFAAVAPASASGAVDAANTFLARHDRPAGAAALSEHAMPVSAALSTRQPSVMEVAVRTARTGRRITRLAIVDVRTGELPRKKAVASLPAEAQPVAASLVKVEEPALLRAISSGRAASVPSVLRLVKPREPVETPAAAPVPALVEDVLVEETVVEETVVEEARAEGAVVEEPVVEETPVAQGAPAPEPLLAAARNATASLEAELERLLAQTGLEATTAAPRALDEEPTPIPQQTIEVGASEPEVTIALVVDETPTLDAETALATDDAPSPEAAAEPETNRHSAGRKRSRGSRRKPRATPSPVPPPVIPFVRPEPVAEPVPEPAVQAQAPTPAPVEALAEAEALAPAATFAEPGVASHSRVRPLPEDPWKVEAEASKSPQVIPFTPRAVESHERPARDVAASDGGPTADTRPEPAAPVEAAPRPAATIRTIASVERRATDASPDPEPAQAPAEEASRGWRINWRRTAAASLAVILLEGVAFATAYWLVKPSEMGTLLVETSQTGVDVLVDGRPSGRTPLTTELKPGRYTLELRFNGASKVIPVEISPGVQTTQQIKWPASSRLGRLKVTTTPPGARILVDGQYRGASPLVLDDVPAGSHTVVAESTSGTVRSQADVGEHELAELDLGIFSGWLTVFAPVEVRIFEGGRLLGTSLDGKLLVAPGPHEIEIVNTRLGYRETRTVDIEPGRHTALSVTGPSGTIVIDAPDGTEVMVDGQNAGTTPLEGIKAPIGTREVVLKHPSFGQRRMTVTVRADGPARLSLLTPQ